MTEQLRVAHDERKAFEEAMNILPMHRDADGEYCLAKEQWMWEAWQARAALAAISAPQAAQGEQEPVVDFPHEQMDALALARYKVVPSDQSMYWRHAVVAGDGQQHLYNGSEVDCQNMARKFAGAFLDGAFAFHSRYTTPVATQREQWNNPAEMADWLMARRSHLGNSRESSQAWDEQGGKDWDNYTKLSEFFNALAATPTKGGKPNA